MVSYSCQQCFNINYFITTNLFIMCYTSPKVTILVPNYNHALFLRERINSILSQTYQNFEIILMDDCSSDNSLEILNEFKTHHKVSHCFFNKFNEGYGKQWKKGISVAKGEYIWIAESDDFADETFLAELIPMLDENPNAGLVYCQSYKVDEQSNINKINSDWTSDLDDKRWDSNFTNNGLHEINNYLCKKCTIPNASGVLFRKSKLNLNDIQEDFIKMGDWYLWISILKKTELIFSSKPLNYFRDTSFSTRVLDTVPKLLKWYQEKITILNYLNRITNKRNRFVNDELNKMIEEYIKIVSIKKLLFSKFYFSEFIFTNFIFVNQKLLLKFDFKKYLKRLF